MGEVDLGWYGRECSWQSSQLVDAPVPAQIISPPQNCRLSLPLAPNGQRVEGRRSRRFRMVKPNRDETFHQPAGLGVEANL